MDVPIYGVVKELVGQISAAAPPGWMRLTQASKRLCLVLAAAAVRSNALESFASDALELKRRRRRRLGDEGAGDAVRVNFTIEAFSAASASGLVAALNRLPEQPAPLLLALRTRGNLSALDAVVAEDVTPRLSLATSLTGGGGVGTPPSSS